VVRIRHFYHLDANGRWLLPAREHVAALTAAGFPEGVSCVNITGKTARRLEVRDWLKCESGWPGVRAIEADGGFEQATLRVVRLWAIDNPGCVVMYAHTKGAFRPTEFNHEWRRSMTDDVVSGWKFCVSRLAYYEVVGPHWIDPVIFPHILNASPEDGGSKTPFFGGNFWWARTDYLAWLPVPGTASRWDAERWIGLGRPHAYDLRSGWPSQAVFSLAPARPNG
jgi:hypothetical protein